jgi:hypothetical protein
MLNTKCVEELGDINGDPTPFVGRQLLSPPDSPMVMPCLLDRELLLPTGIAPKSPPTKFCIQLLTVLAATTLLTALSPLRASPTPSWLRRSGRDSWRLVGPAGCSCRARLDLFGEDVCGAPVAPCVCRNCLWCDSRARGRATLFQLRVFRLLLSIYRSRLRAYRFAWRSCRARLPRHSSALRPCTCPPRSP